MEVDRVFEESEGFKEERERDLSLLSHMSRLGESVTRTVPKDVRKKCCQGKQDTGRESICIVLND